MTELFWSIIGAFILLWLCACVWVFLVYRKFKNQQAHYESLVLMMLDSDRIKRILETGDYAGAKIISDHGCYTLTIDHNTDTYIMFTHFGELKLIQIFSSVPGWPIQILAKVADEECAIGGLEFNQLQNQLTPAPPPLEYPMTDVLKERIISVIAKIDEHLKK